MLNYLLKIIVISVQILLLYCISLVGNFIVKQLHIPLPGSIIGLLLLLALLHFKLIPSQLVAKGAGFLLPLLTLLLIPATVGVIDYPELLSPYGVILLCITIISTLFTLGLTAKLAQKIERKEAADRGVDHDVSHH